MGVTTLQGKDDWETTKLRASLLAAIRKTVDTKMEYGSPKYRSAPHFIEEACKALLEKEGVKA
jgi:hypothetical protein